MYWEGERGYVRYTWDAVYSTLRSTAQRSLGPRAVRWPGGWVQGRGRSPLLVLYFSLSLLSPPFVDGAPERASLSRVRLPASIARSLDARAPPPRLFARPPPHPAEPLVGTFPRVRPLRSRSFSLLCTRDPRDPLFPTPRFASFPVSRSRSLLVLHSPSSIIYYSVALCLDRYSTYMYTHAHTYTGEHIQTSNSHTHTRTQRARRRSTRVRSSARARSI